MTSTTTVGPCGLWGGNAPLIHLLIIQSGPKNLAQFLYTITLSNINKFLKLFHCQNKEKICSNTVTKDPTTPHVCCYTTIRNFTEWVKLSQPFTDHAIGQWRRQQQCGHIEHLM